jgi:multidrug resistance efflux pump
VLAQSEWKLAQRAVATPAAGLVHDTYFVVGDWVPAGSPVASVLPPANIKVRFYAPEPLLGSLKWDRRHGQLRRLRCAVYGDDPVHCRSRGIHAAGPLLQGEPSEARLPRRSETGAGGCRQAASRDSRST